MIKFFVVDEIEGEDSDSWNPNRHIIPVNTEKTKDPMQKALDLLLREYKRRPVVKGALYAIKPAGKHQTRRDSAVYKTFIMETTYPAKESTRQLFVVYPLSEKQITSLN